MTFRKWFLEGGIPIEPQGGWTARWHTRVGGLLCLLFHYGPRYAWHELARQLGSYR